MAKIGDGAKPISREHFHALLNAASLKWKAILLLALNCAYYGKDAAKVKKSCIKKQGDITYIDFPRVKNNRMRINVLWKETEQAINKYLASEPHASELIFVNTVGNETRVQEMCRYFGRLRKRAGVPKEVKLNNLRDGAATALFGNVCEDLQRVTLGHTIKGEKAKYIRVSPEKVQICADVIHKHYFEEPSAGSPDLTSSSLAVELPFVCRQRTNGTERSRDIRD
jgi:hypothetical protein